MEKVVINSFTRNKLASLVDVMYTNEYFGFKEDAHKYVDEILEFIYRLPAQRYKLMNNPKQGKYYCRYQPNRNTTWYVIFDKEEDFYIVKNVTNNHSKDYLEII